MNIGIRFAGTLIVASACLGTSHASAQARSVLHQGEFLGVNQYLVSPNGRAAAVQQSDGNFCVYAAPAGPGRGAWCHMQHRGEGAWFTIMQTDGNLCTYKGTGPGDNNGLEWCSMKYGPEGPHFLVLTNDGNLCTHKGTDPSPSGDWGTLWCTMSNTLQPSAPGVIDVSQTLAGLFNSDPNKAWLNLARAAGAPNPDLWYIESIKISTLDNSGFTATALQAVPYWMGAQQVVNCGSTPLTETVTVTTDVTNTTSLSKSTTFDASVSATVSYSGLVMSGSVTATASTSTTSGSEASTSKTQTFSQSATVTLDPNSGSTFGMKGSRTLANNAPWTATFVPTPGQAFAVVARRLGANDRVNATLSWNEVNNYLPLASRPLKLTGNYSQDQSTLQMSGLQRQDMGASVVAAQCASAPPILAPVTQMNVAAAGARSNVVRQPTPSPNKNVRKTSLSAAQAASILGNPRP